MPSPWYLRKFPHYSGRESIPRLLNRAQWTIRGWYFLWLFPAAMLASCGGLVSSPSSPITVTVTPASAQPFVGTTVQFSATVQSSPNSNVNWMVNTVGGGNATVGVIDSTGRYTAPSAVPIPATVTVTAVSQADSTKSGSAAVTIQGPSATQGPLVLSPSLASLTPSQTLQLNVLTPGVANSDVNWAVDGVPAGNSTVGSISSAGLYTPQLATGGMRFPRSCGQTPAPLGSRLSRSQRFRAC